MTRMAGDLLKRGRLQELPKGILKFNDLTIFHEALRSMQ